MSDISHIPSRCWLLLQIAVWRLGWISVLVVFLTGLALFLWGYMVPRLESDSRAAQQRLLNLTQTHERLLAQPIPQRDVGKSMTAASGAQQSLDAVVYPLERSAVLIQSIYKTVELTGLSVSSSDFQMTPLFDGRYKRLSMVLPLQASYPQLTQMINRLLHSFPGLSVDAVTFERDTVAASSLHAKIQLSLWFTDRHDRIKDSESLGGNEILIPSSAAASQPLGASLP